MDVLYKGGSLLYTQASCLARMAWLLPGLVAANLLPGKPQQPPEGQAAGGGGEEGATWFEGRVTHARRRPVENSFEYPVRMVLVDLDRPPGWFDREQAADHMTAQQAREFAQTDGKVLLLTNPASSGYVQNPISVYYCHDGKGGLATAIAEVTNTPWGERVAFLFDPSGDTSPKALHVSPFMDMDNTWRIKASPPGEGPRLSVSVLVTHPRLGAYFDAHLLLQRCADDQQRRPELAGLRSLLRYGFMPQRVAFWIYWQAVRLIAKGCPIHPKPGSAYREAAAAATGVRPSGRGGAPYVWRDAQQWPWFL